MTEQAEAFTPEGLARCCYSASGAYPPCALPDGHIPPHSWSRKVRGGAWRSVTILPEDRVYHVAPPPKESAIGRGGWPRSVGVAVQHSDGTWRVRLRCSDGVVRKFKTPGGQTGSQRRAIGPELRFAILSRDGFRCRYCGRGTPEVALHIDHILAVAKGGTDDESNLCAACAECNLGKSDSLLESA